MKRILGLLFLAWTAAVTFAATPFEYAPVYTNMTLITITANNARGMAMAGGGILTNDGLGGLFFFSTNSTAALEANNVLDRSIPTPVNAAFTSGAGTLATATYYYRVSALNALGETLASTETSLAITGPAGVNVNWAGVPGATGYKIYGRSTGAELFIAQVGQVHTYLDSGSITPSGALPGSDTTGGGSGRWIRLNHYLYGSTGVIGTLTVTNHTSTGSLAVVTNATVGGTLNVTGSITGGSIIPGGLAAPRVPFTGGGGALVDDTDMTFATDTLTVTKVLAPTSVSTPSIITAAGALGITPAAGSGVNVSLSTTGDFIINTDHFIVDTSTGNVGFGIAPANEFNVSRGVNGSDVNIIFDNSVNAANSGSVVWARVAGTSAGDAKMLFSVTGGDTWAIGVDNSDTDKFKINPSTALGSGDVLTILTSGEVGIGTTSPDALLQVEGGGVLIGAGSNPGSNNLRVVGSTTTGTLVVTTSSTHSYATASTAAVFDADKKLVSSVTTLAELAFVSGVTSALQTQLNARVREPVYVAGDPNFLGTVGDDDGQAAVNTATGGRWHWYAAGAYWLP